MPGTTPVPATLTVRVRCALCMAGLPEDSPALAGHTTVAVLYMVGPDRAAVHWEGPGEITGLYLCILALQRAGFLVEVVLTGDGHHGYLAVI